jgi:hypothetical protein
VKNFSKKLRKNFSNKQAFSSNRFSRTQAGIFALTFAVVGAVILFATHAAGFTTSFEAENSTKNSPAATVSDAGASGGSALKFAKAGTGSCPGTPGRPDGTDPWGTCWPGPLTTGVPTGTTLTNVPGQATSGSGWTWDSANNLVDVTTNNAVVPALNITGDLLISASGVTVKNSKINGQVLVSDNTTHSLTLQDSEVICPGRGTGVSEANVTARRINVHNCENGFDVNQNIDVQDSYLHGQAVLGHPDGLQFAQHYENGQVVPGALNVTIVHNTDFGHDDTTSSSEGSFGTSGIITNPSGDTNILIQHNLFAGGAYTVYCPTGATTNYRLLDNRFSNIFTGRVGYFGPTVSCDTGEIVSGNVYNESGCITTKETEVCSGPTYKAGDPIPMN